VDHLAAQARELWCHSRFEAIKHAFDTGAQAIVRDGGQVGPDCWRATRRASATLRRVCDKRGGVGMMTL
jgi:hypothetical protein